MATDMFKGLYERYLGNDPVKIFCLKWGAAFCAAIVAALLVILPVRGSIADIRRGIQTFAVRDQLVRTLNISQINTQDMLKHYTELLQKEYAAYPHFADRPRIIKMLSLASQSQKIMVKRINFGNPVKMEKREDIWVVPVKMLYEGKYFSIGAALEAVRRGIPYMFTWEDIRIFRPKEEESLIQVELTLAFYLRE